MHFCWFPAVSNEIVVQVATWTDVDGHLSNDIRAMGTPATRVFAVRGEMMVARLRQLAIQRDWAKAAIIVIRAA